MSASSLFSPTIRHFLLASTAMGFGLTGGLGQAFAQDAVDAPKTEPDIIVVVGSQIAGAQPTDALPVSVIRQDELDTIAATSGDELLRSIPQLGAVGFNSSRTIRSIDNARGDTASINLRSLGTGNTLVLMNGRRMVTHPGTQSESFVPAATVNANAIPAFGLNRVEVLLDGASAIYGADAVAGVVNAITKSNLDGMSAELTVGVEDSVDAVQTSGAFEWGQNFNEDRSNLSLFGSFTTRDPVFADERAFTSSSDLRSRLPADWAGQFNFDNRSSSTPWAVLATRDGSMVSVDGSVVTDAGGHFRVQPDALSGCAAAFGSGLCLADGASIDSTLRYNTNDGATVENGIDRFNLFSTFTHEFENGLETFVEGGVYFAESTGYREAARVTSSILVPAENYYNPFGPVGSANRVAVTDAPAEGLDLILTGYRPVDAGPREFVVDNLTTRLLGGLRGETAGWDWETAVLYSEANTEDTANRVSNTLFQEALARSTSDAYNPFNGGTLSDYENGDATPNLASTIADISVLATRKSETSLAQWDARVSRPDLFSTWAGSVGFAAGVEVRRETFRDDRDARIDGTINFTNALSGFASNDLMGTGPALDVSGSRNVESVWAEFAIPLVSEDNDIPLAQSVDLQLAVRHENFDTFGGVTRPKVAMSWRPADFLLVRSAWSEGFRAPNLQQQFETGAQRSAEWIDFVACEAAVRQGSVLSLTSENCEVAGYRPLVFSNSAGSQNLEPEESTNLTAGFVFESTFMPETYGRFSLTADWWRVEQDGIVGAFNVGNHILLDLALREDGLSNPNVIRAAPTAADIAAFAGTGLDPAGAITLVDDNYVNLNRREIEGVDIGLYYDYASDRFGDFRFRVNAAYLSKFDQQVSERGAIINAAIADGVIPTALSVRGEGSLIEAYGRPEWRWTSGLNWERGAYAAGWFTSFTGEVADSFVRRASDNAPWRSDSYQTHNVHFDYTFGSDTDQPTRLRIGARNVFNETPPLIDYFGGGPTFGYLGDLYGPQGRYVYASVRKVF